MKTTWMSWVLAATLAASLLPAQKPAPQPKSQKEVDAIMAVQNATDPDARIAAADNLVREFKDTQFKEFAYFMSMLSYQQKNDFENMLVFGEKTLDENPENVPTLVSLSYAIPLRTREFDLDKEEKLSKADNFAQRALKLIPTWEPPNPNVPPEEWLLTKKEMMSQSHESLGQIAMTRKNYAKAEESFRQALQLAPQQGGPTFYSLALALKEQGKIDEALTAVDQSIAKGGHQLADGRDASKVLKAQLEQLKQGGGAPSPQGQAGQPATPQVQIVQP